MWPSQLRTVRCLYEWLFDIQLCSTAIRIRIGRRGKDRFVMELCACGLQIRKGRRTWRRWDHDSYWGWDSVWSVRARFFWRWNATRDWDVNCELEAHVPDAEVVCIKSLRSSWRWWHEKRYQDRKKNTSICVKCHCGECQVCVESIAERTRALWTGHHQCPLVGTGTCARFMNARIWWLSDSIFQVSSVYLLPIKEFTTSNESVLLSVGCEESCPRRYSLICFCQSRFTRFGE